MANAIALEKGLKIDFHRAYDEMIKSPEYDLVKEVAMIAPSTGASEKYGWLGDVPAVQEWLGEVKAKELAEYDYTITNKNWQTAIQIDRNSLDDDQYGMIRSRVAAMPEAIIAHDWEMIEDLFAAGTTGLSYDGSAFFADRTAPNDNLLAGTGVTSAYLKADILSAYAAMYNFTSDTGRALRLKMDTIVCPVELYATMLETVTAVQGQTSANIPSMLIKRVIPLPGQSDTTDWYGLCTSKSIKPVILQQRQKPEAELIDQRGNRQMIFMAQNRSNAGYGFHQLAVKVVNS